MQALPNFRFVGVVVGCVEGSVSSESGEHWGDLVRWYSQCIQKVGVEVGGGGGGGGRCRRYPTSALSELLWGAGPGSPRFPLNLMRELGDWARCYGQCMQLWHVEVEVQGGFFLAPPKKLEYTIPLYPQALKRNFRPVNMGSCTLTF